VGGVSEVVQHVQAPRADGELRDASNLVHFLDEEAVADLLRRNAQMRADGAGVNAEVACFRRTQPIGHGLAVVVDFDAHAHAPALVLAPNRHVEQRRVEQLNLHPERAGAGAIAVEDFAIGRERPQHQGLDFLPAQFARHFAGAALPPGRPRGFEKRVCFAVQGGGSCGGLASARGLAQAHLQADSGGAEDVVDQLDAVALDPLIVAREVARAGAKRRQLVVQVFIDAGGGRRPGRHPGRRLASLEAARGGAELGELLPVRLGGDAAHGAVDPGGALGGGFARRAAEWLGEEGEQAPGECGSSPGQPR